MKYIYIDKKTMQIKMESKDKMDLPQFDIAEIDENEDLSGCFSWYKDGKIEKQEIKENIRKKAKEDLVNATTIKELKEIINKLI